MRARSAVVLGLALASACASTGSPTVESAEGTAANPQHRGNVIKQEELAEAPSQTAMDAIKRLRPNFLASRGPTSIANPNTGIVVYTDGMRTGDVSALNDILVQDIKQIQYLSAGEATQRFGTGHPSGAILITRK